MEFARGWEPDEGAINQRSSKGPTCPDAKIMAKAKAKASTTWNLGICAICKEPIKGGKVMEIKEFDDKIHADCFACKSCAKPLRGVPYRVHKGGVYCAPCHAEAAGEKCVACGKPLTGKIMKCALGSLHVACCKRSQCGCEIKKEFSTTGGVLTCSSCSSGRSGGASSQRGSANATAKAKPAAKGKQRSPSPGPKPKAKPKAKASMTSAHATAMGIGMDYASLE